MVQTVNGAAASSAFYWMDDATAPLSRFGVDAVSYVLVIDNGEGCSDTMSFAVNDVAPISVQTTLKDSVLATAWEKFRYRSAVGWRRITLIGQG